MKSGGFNLRKWCSNHKKVIEHLPEEYQEESALEIAEDDTKKSLGIHQSPSKDVIKFKVEIINSEKITKRYILSEIAKIFDPVGWLAPVIISAKLIIQNLWIQKMDWDEKIPDELEKQQRELKNQINKVEKHRNFKMDRSRFRKYNN